MVEYVYSAWGNHKALVLNNKGQMVEYDSPDNEGENKSPYSELSQLNPFRYRGYYYDTETGLYFLKTRYYDPEVGRFITIDDLSYLDPESINGLNLYAYCGNNPVMNVDPSGRFLFTLFSIIGTICSIVCATAVSAAVAGVVGGITEVVNGGNFWNGFVGGAISGAISAIGMALGLASGGLLGVVFAAAFGFAGGVLGSYVQQGMSKGWDNINKDEMFFSGAISGFLNVISFGITNCIAKGVDAVIGKNFFEKVVSAASFNGYLNIIGGIVIGFPFALLGVVASTIWNIFKGGNS